MKHLFVFLALVVSLFVVYLIFTGQVASRHGILPAARATLVPVAPAPARAPATDPVGTVRRVIRSGNNLGQNTRKAIGNVDFSRQP